MHTIPVGWVELDGAQNMRDLGGFTARGRVTRPGVLFRSDNLDALADADVERLVHRHRVGLVVDLRSASERLERGPGGLVAAGVAHETFTVVGDEQLAQRREERSASMASGAAPEEIMAEGYWQLLQWGRPAFAGALRRLAQPGGTPAIIHCTAGKDRTGVLAALLLQLVGVSDDDIAADYAATTERLPAMLPRLRTSAAFSAMSAELPAFVLEARAGTMYRFLDRLGATFGDAEGYFAEAGVPRDVIEDWRERFTEPAST